jgi:hypothetical protein
MSTVLLLNWKRPENIRDRILPSLLADPCVSQIWIAHGHPETVFGVEGLKEGHIVFQDKVVHVGDYAANDPLRSFRRWSLIHNLYTSGILPDGYIHVQDDDILFQPGHLESLQKAYEEKKGILISGSVGRLLQGGLYTTTPIWGPCDLVIGQSIFTRVKTISDAVLAAKGLPVEILREDDLALSFLTNPLLVSTSHFAMRCPHHLLPDAEALSAVPGHREARQATVSFMLARKETVAYFSVGAVFKQEAHALREWIEHYQWLGADRIYLIDDGSTDSFLEQIEPYKESVTLIRNTVSFDQFGRQGHIYNTYLKSIPTEWLLLVDLDEFLYSPTGCSVKDFLRSCDSYNQILVPWHIFGSHGHVDQPASLIHGFLTRASEEDTLRINPSPYKAFVRMKSLLSFSVHAHACKGLTWTLPFDGNLVLNHYMIQSLQFYMNVKCSRGSANHLELCPHSSTVKAQAKTKERFEFIDSLSVHMDQVLAQLRCPIEKSVV